MAMMHATETNRKHTRLLVRKGPETFALKLEEVAFFL